MVVHIMPNTEGRISPFEGLRYYDLKRWKIAGEVLNNVEDGVIPYNFEDRFYEWPLPQSEIDKSNGVLIQNENY